MKHTLPTALIAAIATISCTPTEKPPPEPDPGKVKIMMTEWAGYIALYVAKERDMFAGTGLDVEILPINDFKTVATAYASGEVQGRGNIVLDAVAEAAAGLHHKIVIATDYSSGSDVIAAKKGIGSPRDFAGKKIGFEEGTLTEFYINYVLQEAGVARDSIVHVEATPDEAAKMLLDGGLDVAVTCGPLLGKIKESPDHHIVYTSADAPGLITDIVTFRQDFIDEYPGAVQTIVDTYFNALEYVETHPDEAEKILAKAFNCTQEEAKAQLEGVRMLGLRDNLNAFSVGSGLNSLYGNINETMDFLDPPQIFPSDSLIDGSFVKGTEKTKGLENIQIP